MSHAPLYRSVHSSQAVCSIMALAGGLLMTNSTLGQATGSSKYDLDRDRQITPADIAIVVEAFGPCQGCRADVNGSGEVDQADVSEIIAHLGELVIATDQRAAHPGRVIHEAFPGQMPIDPNPRALPVPVSLDVVRLHDLGAVPAGRIAEADALHEIKYQGIEPGPYRLGFTRQLQPRLSIPQQSARRELNENEFLWSFAVRSPGSYETRLHLDHFDVGRSQVILFSQRKSGIIEVHGPYSGKGPEGDGDFWPPSVPGDTVHVEIRGPDEPRFEIVEVVHNDRDRIAPVVPAVDGEGGIAGACASPASVLVCHLDVMCQPVNIAARQATGQMSFVSGGNNTACTGTLLNDLDGETAVPYFLTAYHCLSTQAEVNTLQVMWFFQNTSCGSGVIGTTQVSAGGTLLVTNNTDDGNDMTFIRLFSAPSGIPMAGWTTASLSSGHGIHHPAGTFKRATWFTSGSGLCADVFDYDYYEPTSGAIQGGSSGSGIFNAAGQLAGHLYGTCGIDCGSNEVACSVQLDYDRMYGEFESTWEDTNVSYWLTLGGTIWVWWAAPFPPGNGTQNNPYLSVAWANAASWNGSQIKILAGSYDETPTFNKSVTIYAINGTVTIGQ